MDENFPKNHPLNSICSLFVCLLRENLVTGNFSLNHVLLKGTVPLGLNQRQEIWMLLITYLQKLSQKTTIEKISIINGS